MTYFLIYALVSRCEKHTEYNGTFPEKSTITSTIVLNPLTDPLLVGVNISKMLSKYHCLNLIVY